MYRMFTLIWAIGVVFHASQAQAVTPMGDKVGSSRTAKMYYSGQGSQQALLTRKRTKSYRASRHAHRSHAHARSYRAAQPRKVSHRAQRQTRAATVHTARTRRITASATTKKTRQRHTRAVPAGTVLSGIASYYWQPQRVASGGWFNPKAMTAAHKTLPFGTRVKVTNARNGRTVEVTINDRGPYIAGRIIDLSDAAAGAIGMKSAGVVPVKVEVVGR